MLNNKHIYIMNSYDSDSSLFFDRVINVEFIGEDNERIFTLRSDYEINKNKTGYIKCAVKPSISLSMVQVSSTNVDIHLIVGNLYLFLEGNRSYFNYNEVKKLRVFVGYCAQCDRLDLKSTKEFSIESYNNLEGYDNLSKSFGGVKIYEFNVLNVAQSGLPPNRSTDFYCSHGAFTTTLKEVVKGDGVVSVTSYDSATAPLVEKPNLKGFFILNKATSGKGSVSDSIYKTVSVLYKDVTIYASEGVFKSFDSDSFINPREQTGITEKLSYINDYAKTLEGKEDDLINLKKALLNLQLTYGQTLKASVSLDGKTFFFYFEGDSVDVPIIDNTDSYLPISVESVKMMLKSVGGLDAFGVESGAPVLPAIYDSTFSAGTLKVRSPYFPFIDLMSPLRFYSKYTSSEGFASITFDLQNRETKLILPIQFKLSFSTDSDDNEVEIMGVGYDS